MARDSAFALLGLPERFDLTDEAIESAWKRSVALVHPDRFAGRPAAERVVAERWAGRMNDAKAKILNPVSRSGELLALHGVDLGTETDTAMPVDFLMQQMEWREAIDEGQGDCVRSEIESERARLIRALTQAIDIDKDWSKARDGARRLIFVDKLLQSLDGTTCRI